MVFLRPDTCDPATRFSGRGTGGHGVLLARGGFEPRRSGECLHPKYPYPFATDPVQVKIRRRGDRGFRMLEADSWP